MQHLDEGTIHAWLDGELSPAEAAQAEAHVAECPQCAAAVAEARGFIAASSRILTALDVVPRGVVPISAPPRLWNAPLWRAAAAILVVALGGLVLRNSGEMVRDKAISRDGARAMKSVVLSEKVAGGAVTTGSDALPKAIARRATSPQATSPQATSPQATSPQAASPQAAGQEAAFSGKAVRVAPQLPEVNAAAPAIAAATAMDAATVLPLRIVKVENGAGEKRTLYEVSPSDTVTLTEQPSPALSEVVVTGAATTRVASEAAKRSALANGGAGEPMRVAQTAGGSSGSNNTITWLDPSTGSVLRLSGRMSEERLREIKSRIERQRAAAAAAAKKSP